MTQATEKLASHSSRVCDASGRPVLVCPPGWRGPELERFVIPSAAECGPQATKVPTLFVSRSGAGRRWYRSGHRVLELVTGPLIDVYSSRYERDHARWEGTSGETICVRLPHALTQRLLHDEADRFDLQTLYGASDPHLTQLVHTLADEVQHGLPNDNLYAEGLCLALVGWLSRHYAAAKPVACKVVGLTSVKKQRVCDLIEASLGERLRIEDLADSVCLSAFHFARQFKATFGESPHRYLLRRRVETAVAALRSDRDRSIADIALACGFASQAHLTDAMRRGTGLTPAKARTS